MRHSGMRLKLKTYVYRRSSEVPRLLPPLTEKHLYVSLYNTSRGGISRQHIDSDFF